MEARDPRAPDLPPGSIVLSRDGKTRYKVQPDGSWRKIGPQEEGELEKVARRRGVRQALGRR